MTLGGLIEKVYRKYPKDKDVKALVFEILSLMGEYESRLSKVNEKLERITKLIEAEEGTG